MKKTIRREVPQSPVRSKIGKSEGLEMGRTRFTLNRGALTGYRLVIGLEPHGHLKLSLDEEEYQELKAEVERIDAQK